MKRFFVVMVCGLSLSAGCGPQRQSGPTNSSTTGQVNTAAPAHSAIKFVDIAASSGISFTLGHNGKTPLTILETSGGGCAFLDFDLDGKPDILLVGPHNVGLYHNIGGGKFTDVTPACGIPRDRYWMGCAVGDYDGDGKPDIFLTGYHCFGLFHNEGGGHFRDVTAESGITGLDWSLSAVFADFNGDGKMDLFVSQYLKFDEKTQQICQVGAIKSACGPEIYTPLTGHMYYNLGGGKFKLQPWTDTGKTWGALASDLTGSGKPMLYLSNDMMAGDLFSSQNGRWKNIGANSGTAYDAQGHFQGGMGVDSADYDNDGKLDLVVTTFFAQPISLYHNDGNGLFTEVSSRTHLGPPTMPYVGFGTAFADFDNSGWQHLIIANGHVRDNVHNFDSGQNYVQPVQVFRNDHGKFEDISSSAATDMKLVGRGLSIADYDGDGKPDVLICNLEGPAMLLHNETPNVGHWLDVRLEDHTPNTVASGALISLTYSGGSQIREIRTSGTVMSAQLPMAHFGLGASPGKVQLKVRWPDGKVQDVEATSIDRILKVKR